MEHFHKTLTETYFILYGKLHVWKNQKEYFVGPNQSITFYPYEKHRTQAENGFVWLEVYSQPGWKFTDHILVDNTVS